MFFRRQGAAARAAVQPAAAAGPFGEGGVAAQLAISTLVPFYPKSIAPDGRVPAASLFSIVGALAGFAAQYAIRQEMAAAGGIDAHALVVSKRPGAPINPAAPPDGVVIAVADNGERYYFADAINALLMPQGLTSMSAFSLLGGQAMRLGAAKADLPDCFAILEHAVDTMGTPEYGAPRGPAGHKPGFAPRKAIEIFWPATKTAFTREPIRPVPGFSLLEPRLWPVALATVAATYMEMVKTALPPGAALTIFMEAALPMSKIDQAAVAFAGEAKH